MNGSHLDSVFGLRLPAELAERLPDVAEAQRLQRNAWFDEAWQKWLEGEEPSTAARLFVASAMQAWRANDRRSLESLMRLRPPRGRNQRARLSAPAEVVKIGDEDEDAPRA